MFLWIAKKNTNPVKKKTPQFTFNEYLLSPYFMLGFVTYQPCGIDEHDPRFIVDEM